ncbi:GIY-YIG nuclease family protein [Streptomyces aureocirculatus]|uniref:GIY-YIG nuclease family protein n=1 Tax=Streptomyces aureocirculatus TaxID=67275 RepID=UPI0004CC903F|nr:GIY-YIG nuclease family protein [Streptomyces aureocirculatus]
MDYAQPAAVYRLYDAAGHLLYIGLTCNPRSRWKDHRKEMLWWREVAFKVILYNAYETFPRPGIPPQPYGHRIAYQHRETRPGYRIQWFLWRLGVQDTWATETEQRPTSVAP